MFIKPQKIIFKTLLQKIKLNSVKPRQLNLNIELVTQLKIDIKEKWFTVSTSCTFKQNTFRWTSSV